MVPGVTEIGGMSAAGKTQLCLQLCLQVQLPLGKGGLNSGRERGGWGGSESSSHEGEREGRERER